MYKKKNEFGGSLLVGKRKSKRPLHFHRQQHLVLKAEDSDGLLSHVNEIQATLNRMNDLFQVQPFNIGIQPDHIHMSPEFSDRTQYTRWIRAVTGRLAQKIPHLKWKLRPYTRPTFDLSGRTKLKKYIQKNREEGEFVLGVFNRVANYRSYAEKIGDINFGFLARIKKS
jgi:hypothetical protein